MQLLIRGAAGFLSRPDNNRRAKVRLFYFIANDADVFFCISTYFRPYFQHKREFFHLLPHQFRIFNISLDKSIGVNADYTYQDDNGKTITSKMETEADYGANINFTINKVLFKGLWMLQASLSGSYDKTEVAHNNFDGTNFNMHEWSGSFSLFNTFRLSKDRSWVARCFMYASTGSKGLTKKFDPKFNLSLMLSKSFKFGGTLQLEYMNLLFTQTERRWNYTNEKYMHNYYGKNPQQLVVSFSIPFGKSRIRGAAYKNSDKLSSRLGK